MPISGHSAEVTATGKDGWPTFLLRAFAVILGVLPCLRADEVSRAAPPIYVERLAPLLTPTQNVLKAADGMDVSGQSGVTLIYESIQVVEPDGQRITAVQVAYRTLTDAGIKANADDVFSFRRSDQRFHLITAETIQADGAILPVRPNAILLQTPQRSADYSIYDDQAEVRVIYPDVKPGCVTHAVYVIENLKPRMPDEFTAMFNWNAGWPIGRQRHVVELGPEMANRLRVFGLGVGTPVPTKQTKEGEWVRYTWTRDHIAAGSDEIAPAPASQVGPSTHVTTLDSWARVADWYGSLLKGRDTLKPELAAKVDGWTNAPGGRDGTLSVLLAKVADEVRYTGLELGEADYRPHDCNEVWANRYGDCKDKANLLVAFLRHKGISAWVALANTRHAGVIDQRAPDYRIFNHALVAVAAGTKGYVFCDPTIDFAHPGLLSPSDADRDVLVIRERGGVWAHTPPQDAGRTRYSFDLKLSPAGELSGWLTIRADGYAGLCQRRDFRELDPDQCRDEMVNIVRGFYPAANVVDVARTSAERADAEDVEKAYFLVPAQTGDRTARQTLVFPQSATLFLDLGQDDKRETTLFLSRQRIEVHSSIALPAGVAPGALPADLLVGTPAGEARASWRFEKAVCRADLEMSVTHSTVSAKEFGRFYQAQQSLRAWLATPLVLSPGRSAPPAAEGAAEVDLPLMPSGDGQLNLVDERYPEDGNHELRRVALDQTLRYFPHDRAVAFRAGARLANLDWLEDKNQAALDRIQALLGAYRADVTPETYAWGEYIEAVALRDLKREGEALTILARLAGDTNLSGDRRALSAAIAADILRTKAPDRSLDLLNEVAGLPSSYSGAVFSRLAHLLLTKNDQDTLRQRLKEVVQSRGDEAEAILERLLEDSAKWNDPGDDERHLAVIALIKELVPQPGSDLQAALKKEELHAACLAIQLRLRASLAESPLREWAAPDAKLQTQEQYIDAIGQAEGKSDPATCLRLSVQALVTFAVDDGFPRQLWKAAGYCDWIERQEGKRDDEPIYGLLLDLCDRLPAGHEYYFEGRILRAKHLGRIGDTAGEQAVYEGILETPGVSASFVAPVCSRLGASFEAAGDYGRALVYYRRLEPLASDYSVAADGLLRAVFINLEQDHAAEALRLIHLLEKAPEETRAKTNGQKMIEEFVALAQSGQSETFWAAGRSWWPKWQALSESLGVSPTGKDIVVPMISDLAALGKDIGTAIRAEDRRVAMVKYNQLVSAARWLPSLAAESASVAEWLTPLFPGDTERFRKAMLEILAVPHPRAIPGLRNRQLYLAADLVDDGQPREALKVIADFNAVKQPEDTVSRSMRRIWGLAALGTTSELKPCTAAIERDLANAGFTAYRVLSVQVLDRLYQAQKRATDEEALLRREMENPVVASDTDGLASLKARYLQLVGSRRFAAEVAAWIKASTLDWYEITEPTSLDDPRLHDLDRVLKGSNSQFSPVEFIKLELLVAQDLGRSLEAQRQAWIDATTRLYYLLPSWDEANRLAESIIDNPKFDDDIRTRLLWNVLTDTADHGRKSAYTRWRADPLVAKLNSSQQRQLHSIDLLVTLDRSSDQSVRNLASALTAREISPLDILILRDSVRDLLRLGDQTGAHELVSNIPSWQLSANVEETKDTLGLEFAKQIRAAEARVPMHEALIRRTLEQFPSAPTLLPEVYDRCRQLDFMPALEPDITLRAYLQRIKTRQFDQSSLLFWVRFMRMLPPRVELRPFIIDLARLAIAEALDDGQRADAVQAIRYAVDWDDPSLRQQLMSLLAQYRRPEEAPLTYAQIRIAEVLIDLRTGQPVNLPDAFEGLRAPDLPELRFRTCARHWIQTGDKVDLERLIDKTSPDLLANPDLLDITLPAFEMLAMKTESEMARRIASRELKQALTMSWVTLDEFNVDRAVTLAELLRDPTVLPDSWVGTIEKREPDLTSRERTRLVDAWLRHHWVEVNNAAAALVELHPTLYRFYWYRGAALYHLGRKQDAIDALSTFVHYAKDDLDYPKALGWLREMGAKIPQG